MAVYLTEHQAGFDAATIGFPSLHTCLGAVLQTDHGLYGYHFADTDMQGIETRGAIFKAFIDGKWPTAGGTKRHLFGTCNRTLRFKQDPGPDSAAWKAQMRKLADILGYTGTISGFDTHVYHASDEKTSHCTYVEYRQAATEPCSLYYKRNRKMDYQKGAKGSNPDVKRAIADGRLVDDIPFTSATVIPNPKTQKVATLHHVGWRGFHSFKHP